MNSNKSIYLIIFLIILNIFFMVLCFRFFESFQTSVKNERMNLKIIKLTTNIAYLDEILTMTAKMAVYSKEPEWEKKFLIYSPQMEASINELLNIAPSISIQQTTSQLKFANNKLIEFESTSFKLVNNGLSKQAVDLLSSSEYSSLKLLLSQKIQMIEDITKNESKKNIFMNTNDHNWFLYGLIISVACLIITWLITIKIIYRRNKT
jgi:hypothetical protein